MSALIVCLLPLFALPTSLETPVDDAIASKDASASPVILAQAQTKKQPRRRRRRRQANNDSGEKNFFVDTYWNIFRPPGTYSIEVGLAGGTNFLNTAYNGQNPNIMLRAHGAYKWDRNLPFAVFGAIDYNVYEQTAGPLSYSTNNVMIGAGAGVKFWYYAMRLDALLELGYLARIASQTDGRGDPITTFGGSLAGSLWTNIAFSLGGSIALSFQLGARYHSLRSFDLQDARLDYMVLGGLEYMFDSKPYDPYP